MLKKQNLIFFLFGAIHYNWSKWAKLQTIFSVTKRFTKDSHKLRQIMKTIHIEFWEYAFRHVSFCQMIGKINRQMKNGSKMKLKSSRKIKEKSRNRVKKMGVFKVNPEHFIRLFLLMCFTMSFKFKDKFLPVPNITTEILNKETEKNLETNFFFFQNHNSKRRKT